MSRSFVSLSASGLTVAAGPHILLARIDLVVAPGTRLGLVGPNGSGKSTLLRALAGLQAPEQGKVTLAPGNATVGYLPQETDPVPDETGQGMRARRTGVTAAQHELDRATADLAAEASSRVADDSSGGASGRTPDSAADDTPPGERYASALDRWLSLGGADIEPRSAAVVDGLGLPTDVLDQEVATLSGGQAARVRLAALLLARFDMFLLDEPTNDLDLEGLERLEQFVAGLDGPVVVVSHDRAFLERTVTAVAEIDDHGRTLTRYEGGWQAYLDERERARRHAEEAHQTYTDRRDDLAERARRQREWSAKGIRTAKRSGETDKNIRFGSIQGAQRMATRARKSEDALSRLKPVEKPWEGWDLQLRIADAGRGSTEVARLTDAVVEHPGTGGDGGTEGSTSGAGFRLGPVSLQINRGDRMAVTGPNGSGKSTLLHALLGRVPLVAGSRHLGPSVVVGEISQDRDTFAGSATLLEGFVKVTGAEHPAEARSVLAKFGLGADHVTRSPASLSPGERTRATLATLQARGVNLLVLDEPTNHLDLPAIEQLEQAVATFEGTLLLVSHDRQLVDAIGYDRLLELAGGKVRER